MNSSITVAIITVSGSVIVAALSFFLTKLYERKADWQRRKIEHYKELLTSMSGVTESRGISLEAHVRYADAVNTIALVAPQYVIDALMNFQVEACISNRDRSVEKHDYSLKCLLLAIRKDIGISKDSPNTFSFHLAGTPPPDIAAQSKSGR